ncbi:hypothetical protein ACFYXH_00855 [Streptomyces sp. NPDC002730]|uniref:hypothetical protein n=1 Tax=Streptomyces sp. NPDC002730 TaxID=3364662 RepID=UPI0036ABABB6
MGLRRVLARIAGGSGLLARQFGRWLLPGTGKAAAGRLTGTLAGTWMLGGMALAAPGLMWALAGGWCVAAWRTGAAEARAQAAQAAFVQWIRDQIGDRNGVLLAELLAGLHAADMHLDWDVTDVRAVVERLGIPVRDSLKVAGSVSIGVHVDDLTAVWDVQLSPPSGKVHNPSPAGLTSDNYPTTPRVERTAEGAQITVYPV